MSRKKRSAPTWPQAVKRLHPRAFRRLLAFTAHELRTSVHSIQACASLMLADSVVHCQTQVEAVQLVRGVRDLHPQHRQRAQPGPPARFAAPGPRLGGAPAALAYEVRRIVCGLVMEFLRRTTKLLRRFQRTHAATSSWCDCKWPVTRRPGHQIKLSSATGGKLLLARRCSSTFPISAVCATCVAASRGRGGDKVAAPTRSP